MAERDDGQADADPSAADAWRGPFANGALLAVVATILLWGAFKEFKPPPEEPTSVQQMMDETDETIRRTREFIELSRERSRITDALDERIEALEARRKEVGEQAGLDDELRRLQRTLLSEMETTNRLLDEKNAVIAEKNRREDAARQEEVARAAAEWQRGRPRLMAMAAAAWAVAGWLFVRAFVLRRRHSTALAAAEAHGLPDGQAHAAADSALAEEGGPLRGPKVFFFTFQVAVCVGAILFGLLGPAPQAGAKDEREGLVVIGLAGLALSTIWLFFGSINWSTWNAIKGLVNGRAAGDTDGTRDRPRPTARPDDRA